MVHPVSSRCGFPAPPADATVDHRRPGSGLSRLRRPAPETSREFARGVPPDQRGHAGLRPHLPSPRCSTSGARFDRPPRTDLGAGRSRRAVGACCAVDRRVRQPSLAVIHTFFPSFFAISRITLEPTIGAYGAATDAVGISRLHGQLLALAPNLAGVAAAVMGSLHAAVVTRSAVAEPDRSANGNGATPGEVPASLLNGMVVVSGVLVASVLLVSLHVHAHGPCTAPARRTLTRSSRTSFPSSGVSGSPSSWH